MMIYRVEIENFYSVRERQIVDLAVRAEAPDDLKKVVKINDNPDAWVPRVVAVFGPNASGKSNVLRAISFTKLFATSSALGPSNRTLPYFKFKTQETENSPTTLSISFASNRDLSSNEGQFRSDSNLFYKYTYKIKLSGVGENNTETVISESLHSSSEDQNVENCIFERNEDGQVKLSDRINSYEKLDILKNNLKPEASVISTLWADDDRFASNVAKTMHSVFTNIIIDRQDSSDNYIKRYVEDTELLESINFELGRFDFGVNSVEIFDGLDGPDLCFNHDGLSRGVTTILESHGTKRFIATYPILSDALKHGGVAVIDEFDISLHPMVLPEIVRWFEDPEKNPYGAQLWMTCHSITIMRNLIREGIVLCEKSRRGSSSVYSLGSVEGVRRNEDFMEGYINGVFGGVPIIG